MDSGLSVTIFDVFHALIFILPAYCANGMPVIFGGGHTIDGGRTFLDKKPIFGSHKTFRGFLAGLIIKAVLSAHLQRLDQGELQGPARLDRKGLKGG